MSRRRGRRPGGPAGREPLEPPGEGPDEARDARADGPRRSRGEPSHPDRAQRPADATPTLVPRDAPVPRAEARSHAASSLTRAHVSHEPPRPGRHPTARTPRARARRSIVAAIALAVVAAVAVAAFVVGSRRDDDAALWGDLATGSARTPLPAARVTQAAARSTAADFAGAESCASCHAEQHAAWTRSTHGRAGGPPAPGRVIAPFDGRAIRFRDAEVIPAASGGSYTFTVRRPGEPDRVLRVDGVVGGGHMRGGGTQGFVTRWADGTWRFIPFDWSRATNAWFCNSAGRENQGWIPIAADLPLNACGDWPPARVLGDEPRWSNCQGCHASRLDVALDTAAHARRTSFATLAIDCESCHGPARAHVDRARAGTLPPAGDGAMRPLATLAKDASMELCLQCHAVKARLDGGHLPGRSLAEHYSTRLALLGDTLLHPDGRTRTFAYQEGHLWSDCYVSGGMTCTSCHDPHSQGYRDADGVPLAGPAADGQCTSCHASKGVRLVEHTKHAATSAGSRCVSCHMPYLQQPAVGARIRYARSDHTIPVPRPGFDSSLGVRSACAGCHADRTVARLDADVKRLWGELKPHAAPVAALARAGAVTDAAEGARLLLDTATVHTAAQFAGLAAYVERFVAADAPALDRDALLRLRALARARDLDVRALALAALHYAGGERAGVRRFLAERLWASADDDAPLRARWATALGVLGDRLRERGDAPGAATAYRKALELRPTDARLLLNLGLALAAGGNAPAAAEQYRRAIAADPAQPLALVNLGVALEGQGDLGGAAEAYRRAIAVDAFEPMAYANLGNAYLRGGDVAAAVPLYERALALDPSLASVHFALAQAHGQRGELAAALAALRRGLAFDSSDAQVRALADTLAARLGASGARR